MTDAPRENQENLDIREEGESRWISIELVADRLGVKRPAVYYYIKKLQIPTKKFAFDRKAYIPIADFERIKSAKAAALPGLR
jgi:hypothetical protein